MSEVKPRSFPPRRGLGARAWAILAACLVLALAAAWIALRPPATPASLIGGPFHLETGDGKPFSDADVRGKPFLVYFGYTHCPDVCPTTLAQISDVLARLPEKPIRVLFVTVDPERDTPKSMADYVSSFDPRIVGLSGGVAEIAAMERAYRVYARKAPTRDGDYSMDHSSVVYLMDASGRFVEAFNMERSADEAAKELATYF